MTAKVMIVDDEVGIRDVVSRYLTEDGMDVVTASSGSECTENILIVLLTTVTSASAKEEDLKQYVLDYIPKPADMEQMSEVVKNYLGYFDK